MEKVANQPVTLRTAPVQGDSTLKGFALGIAVIFCCGFLFTMVRSFYVAHWSTNLESDRQYQDAVMLGRADDRAAVNHRIQDANSRISLVTGITSLLLSVLFVIGAVAQIKRGRRRFGTGMLISLGVCFAVSLVLLVAPLLRLT